MSRIDRLIEQLCPDGVEYKRFDEVCSLKARIGWQRLTKNEQQLTGDYMLITGTDFTATHAVNYETCVYVSKERFDQDKNIQLRDGDVLITKDGTLGKVAVVESLPMPATLNGGVFVVRDQSGKLDNRFIMHYLLSGFFSRTVEQQSTGSTISHLTQKLFSRLVIPVPPMEVQQEIVRVLDSFADLEADLEANLEVELKARQSQFDYYRNRMLIDSAEGAAKVPLARIGTFTGSTPKKSEQRFFGDEHPFYKPGDFNTGESIGTSEDGLTSEGLAASRVVPQDATMVVCIGATIGKVGYALETGSCNQQINVILPNEDFNPRYVFHLANSRIVQDQIARLGNFSSMPILSLKKFNQIEIPVPPREIQDRVANALDKFDAIIHDISDGIPAEISARQAQYAYYRDRLLAFREKVA